jgi:hypothetical protein
LSRLPMCRRVASSAESDVDRPIVREYASKLAHAEARGLSLGSGLL